MDINDLSKTYRDPSVWRLYIYVPQQAFIALQLSIIKNYFTFCHAVEVYKASPSGVYQHSRQNKQQHPKGVITTTYICLSQMEYYPKNYFASAFCTEAVYITHNTHNTSMTLSTQARRRLINAMKMNCGPKHLPTIGISQLKRPSQTELIT